MDIYESILLLKNATKLNRLKGADSLAQIQSDNAGALTLGQRDFRRDVENSDMIAPPVTDHCILSHFRFSFSDTYINI